MEPNNHSPPDLARVDKILRDAEDVVGRLRRDDKSATLACSIRQTASNTATMLTSKAALRAFDPVHPERILCIVFSVDGKGRVAYAVVVNNREFQGAAQLVRILSNADGLHLACGVCLDAPCDRRSNTMIASRCPHCLALTCERCLRKILGSRPISDVARRCHTCRRWHLSGDSFGTPLGDPWRAAVHGGTRSAADVLVDDVIARLDGTLEVIPRLGVDFVCATDDSMTITRLTGTDRCAEACRTRLRHIRKRLSGLFADVFRGGVGAAVHVYIYRKTWRIDATAERPIVEVSVFRVLGEHGPVLQLRTDAWIQVLRQDDDDACHVHVEYLSPPADFPVPAHIRSALDEIARVAKGRLFTASVTCVGESDVGFNFDCSYGKDGQIANSTMHARRFEASLDVQLRAGGGVFLARVWRDVCGGAAEAIAFVFDAESSRRMRPDECEARLLENADGLRGSTRSVRYL